MSSERGDGRPETNYSINIAKSTVLRGCYRNPKVGMGVGKGVGWGTVRESLLEEVSPEL